MYRVMLLVCLTAALPLAAFAHVSQNFVEGRNYSLLVPAQHTGVPAGKSK